MTPNNARFAKFVGYPLLGLILLAFTIAATTPDKPPAAAATPAATAATTTAPESTEAERWAIQVVYAKKCSAELPPTFVLGSVLKLESFPSDVAQAAYDKTMKSYYRGPSSWCYAFGIPIRRVVREFLAD